MPPGWACAAVLGGRRAALEIRLRLLRRAAPGLRFEALPILGDGVAVAQHMRDRTHQHPHHRFVERRERVVHPQAFLSGRDQPFPAQIRQVPGRRGLRDSQAVVDVADADLAVRQQAENPKPGRIRKGFEGFFQRRQPSRLLMATYMLLDKYTRRHILLPVYSY